MDIQSAKEMCILQSLWFAGITLAKKKRKKWMVNYPSLHWYNSYIMYLFIFWSGSVHLKSIRKKLQRWWNSGTEQHCLWSDQGLHQKDRMRTPINSTLLQGKKSREKVGARSIMNQTIQLTCKSNFCPCLFFCFVLFLSFFVFCRQKL